MSSTTTQLTETGGTGHGTYTAELRFTGFLSATVTDASGNTSEFSTTVSLPAGTQASAPELDVQSTTGSSNTVTRDNGTPSAPLVLNVPNSNPSNYFRLFDVTNPAGPALVAGPTQEVGGVITVAGAGLSPGTHTFAYTTASTPNGAQSSLSPPVSITIQPSLALTSTSPADNTVVSALPGGVVTVTFSHPLAGLTSGGPAVSGTDPYGIFLLARGPSGAFSAPGTTSTANGYYSGNLPLHTTATYQVNANGTASIVLRPTLPLSSDVYTIK